MKNITLAQWSNNEFKGYYKHIVSKDFDRITISYGFYNRTLQNTLQTGYFTIKPDCIFNFPFNVGWYFGVNLRIKCQQGTANNQNNINLATQISKRFCKYIIPHYVNTHNDQGVDFFVFPIVINNNTLNGLFDKWYNDVAANRIHVNNVFTNNTERIEGFKVFENEDDIIKWIEDMLKVFRNLLQDNNLEI